jgi:hypothetical protein
MSAKAEAQPPVEKAGSTDDIVATSGKTRRAMSANGDTVRSPDRLSQSRDKSGRVLTPAAQRALAEAEARRARPEPDRPREWNGRKGPDPVRYGDWEVKGIASDF